MSVYVYKMNCALTYNFVNGSKISGNINTSTALIFPSQSMITQLFIKGLAYENEKSFIELVSNFYRNLLVFFLEWPMK